MSSKTYENKLAFFKKRKKRISGIEKKPKKIKFIKCKYCAALTRYRKGKKFCGLLCRNRNRAKRKSQRLCLYCREKLVLPKTKYCSEKCSDRALHDVNKSILVFDLSLLGKEFWFLRD